MQQIHQIQLRVAAFAATNPGTSHTAQTTNDTGAPIYVIGGWVWMGASKDGFGDIPVQVRNLTTGDDYLITNVDRYANPPGIADNIMEFPGMNGNYYLVNPGDVLELLVNGTGPYGPSTALEVAASCWINYVLEQP